MTDLAHEERVLTHIAPELARAEVLRQQGELPEALRAVEAYMVDHFDDVPSLMLAAHIFLDAGRIGMVHPLLKRATQLEPNVPVLWNNLGICYQEGADHDEGEAHFFRALKLDPNDANAHINLGQLYVNTTQPFQALKHLNAAINLDPSLSEAYYNRALANVSLGRWEEGWQDYDAGFDSGTKHARARKERIYGLVPRWNGDEGKTIIAYGEQGVGDEIAFASCLPDLMKQNKVILECDPKLWGLFKRSFGLETHGTRFEEKVSWVFERKAKTFRKFDGAVALGSLPRFYRNMTESFPGTPYLIADPIRRIGWRAILDALGPKLKVGITWTGGNKNTGRARRSLGLDDLLPILRQDATFVSLQYHDAPEIEALKRDHGITIHHWKHAVQTPDYDDTAALVAELDLVISVTTAAIHLSGALGQECWVMAPKTPRWFYGISGKDLPWYQSVRLYRQRFKWVDTISDIAKYLRDRVAPTIKVVT